MSIRVQNLTKAYGEKKAVDSITFEVHSGEIVGFLGPNGAGKTTTMRAITGYLTPTVGTVEVLGTNVQENSLEVRRQVGYLPENNPLYNDMNVLEYLEFSALLNGVPKNGVHRHVREMVGICGLSDVKHMDIGQLSKGYRQRVGLAQAMIHDPNVLILDEPTSGLDPNQIVEIRNLIRQLGREKTLILSTHILPEVQASCNRVIIINRGKIVADGSTDELQSRFQGNEQYYIELEKPESESLETIRVYFQNVPSVAVVEPLGEFNGIMKLKLETSKGADVRKHLFQLSVRNNWTLLELHREQTSLEDVFHELTHEEEA
jgi:ABC-2 type transport system ATP-binding protein